MFVLSRGRGRRFRQTKVFGFAISLVASAGFGLSCGSATNNSSEDNNSSSRRGGGQHTENDEQTAANTQTTSIQRRTETTDGTTPVSPEMSRTQHVEIADLISVSGRNRFIGERVHVEGFTTRCMLMDCTNERCDQDQCCRECTTQLGVSRFSNAANGCLTGMRSPTDDDIFDIAAVALRFPDESGCRGTECEQSCEPIPVRQYYAFEGVWRREENDGRFDYYLEVDTPEFVTDDIRSNSAVEAVATQRREYGGDWSVHRTWEMVRPVLIEHILVVRAEWEGGCVDQQFTAHYRIREERAEVWLRRSSHRDECDASTWQRLEVLLPNQVLNADEIVLRGPGFSYQMR